MPELRRRIRELEDKNALSISALVANSSSFEGLTGEGVYDLFHRLGRCLVCGHEMSQPKRRDIGWGEFKQCGHCQFSAHEMASYETRKQAAKEQLTALIRQARKTQSVLRDRKLHCQKFQGQ